MANASRAVAIDALLGMADALAHEAARKLQFWRRRQALLLSSSSEGLYLKRIGSDDSKGRP